MEAFIPILPSGQPLVIFVICLAIGAFVIIKYCLDQFDKPITTSDDRVPWKFVVPSLLTSRRQYLTGFAIYCSAILLIFFIVSVVVGPGNFYFILRAIGAALTQSDLPPGTAPTQNSLQAYPTFPIVVAFYIVGLNPNLPKFLNFEEPVRRLAHRLAYIPRNMDRIFTYMRFSQFDMPKDDVKDAYAASDLRRPSPKSDDLKAILPILDRAVKLHVDAATLAGDLSYQQADRLLQRLDLNAFKQYRTEIQNVGANLQGINSRVSELAELNTEDGQKTIRAAQRDLNRNLETLYVIFACASTVQDTGRIADRLRVIGFSSPFPPRSAVPWNPILRVIGAAAVILFVAYEFAARTWPESTFFPPGTGSILKLLLIILFVHTWAIGQAINRRTRLIAADKYLSETGRGNPLAYANIFLWCWTTSMLWYLVLNIFDLPQALSPAQETGSKPLPPAAAVLSYVKVQAAAALIPATCGAISAYTVDRPSDTLIDRGTSSLLLAISMGLVAVMVVRLTAGDEAPLAFQIFNLVVYGALGGVIGFSLPAGLRRFWHSLEKQLPDQISLLRANVLEYFHNLQQFNEWLNTPSGGLEDRRPLDVLAENGGLQRLTTFVGATRARVATAPA
jgi:hypothetical protein